MVVVIKSDISDLICVPEVVQDDPSFIVPLKVSLLSVHPPVQHYGGGESAVAAAPAALSLPAEMEIERSFVFR